MSPEQPKKIHELLERYARKRRDQSGSHSMHPADRRLLQGEVARQFADERRRGAGWLGGFAAWRVRLAVTATVMAAAGIGFWSMRERSQQEAADRDAKLLAQLSRDQATKESAVAAKRELSSTDGKARSESLVLLADRTSPGMAQSTAAAASTALAEQGTVIAGTVAPSSENIMSSVERLQRMKELAVGLAPNGDPPGDAKLYQPPSFLSVAPLNEQLSAAPLTRSLPEQQAPEALKKVVEYEIVNRERLAGVALEGQEQNLARARQLPQFATGLGAGKSAAGATALAPTDEAQNISKLSESRNQANQAAPPFGAELAMNSAVYFRQTPSPQAAQAGQDVQRRAETLATPNRPGSGALSVLSRFTVEQRGQMIRFVDADSSVYEGPIVGNEAAAVSEAERRLDRDTGAGGRTVAARARMMTPTAYSFRAAGTNRTRGEPVVVNGTISGVLPSRAEFAGERTAAGANPGAAGWSAPAGQFPRSLAPSAPSPSNTMVESNRAASGPPTITNVLAIEGTVRVGASSERPFKAVPVQP